MLGLKRHFRFEPFWAKIPGFAEVVATTWEPSVLNVDYCRVLDCKLRAVAKALRKWSNANVGSVWLQLAIAREVILCLDGEEEQRVLTDWELELRRLLKVRVLGLASLARTISRQRSRALYLAEGDANTRFFHLQACHCGRHNMIRSLRVNGAQVVSDEGMADALFDNYNGILGNNFVRTRMLNLQAIGVPSLDLHTLEFLFSEEEVHAVVMELPADKAPGLDGFTGRFYKAAWNIIK